MEQRENCISSQMLSVTAVFLLAGAKLLVASQSLAVAADASSPAI